MAVLIERACTPIFASKMDTDSNSDGVVDGFTSAVDSGITATFSRDDSAQKINMTASTAAGEAKVKTDYITVSANTVYSLQVLVRGTKATGNPLMQIKIEWYDSTSTLLSTTVASDTAITAYWKRVLTENVTSPANAAKAMIICAIKSSAAGDVGAVWYKYAMLEQFTLCTTFCTTTRAADTTNMSIAPVVSEWSISGAFALTHGSTAVLPINDSYIVTLYNNQNYRCALDYSTSRQQFLFQYFINWTYPDISIPSFAFPPYIIFKFVISLDAQGKRHMFIRPNNQPTKESHSVDAISLSPCSNIKVGSFYTNTNPHALIESVTLYRDKAITTLAEADAIFDNMNAEMVVNGGFDNGSTGWTLKNGSVWENGRIKRIATESSGVGVEAARQEGIYSIKVLPNNRYKLKARLSGYVDANNTPYIQPIFKDLLLYASTVPGNVVKPTSDNQVVESVFTTEPNTYYVQPLLGTYGTCTAYFDDISLQLIN